MFDATSIATIQVQARSESFVVHRILEVVGVGLIPKNCRRSTPRCKRVEPHVHVTCAHVDNDVDGRSRTKRFQEPPQYFSSVAPIFGAQAPLFEIVRLRVAVLYGPFCQSVGHLDV